jgi:hypothetical protein
MGQAFYDITGKPFRTAIYEFVRYFAILWRQAANVLDSDRGAPMLDDWTVVMSPLNRTAITPLRESNFCDGKFMSHDRLRKRFSAKATEDREAARTVLRD